MTSLKKTPVDFSVLTFNTWGLRVGKFSIARRIDQRLRAMAAEIRKLNADLISFQEVWTDEAASFLYHNLDYKYYYYNPGRAAFKGYMGNGLLILSRYPVVEQKTIFFDHHTDWFEYYAHKGALMVQVETPAGYVNVYNTHLGSGNKPNHIQNRKRQLSDLLSWIGKTSQKQPSLLTGDLNFNPGSEEYGALVDWMREAFNDDAFDSYTRLHPAENGFTFYVDRSYKSGALRHGINERIDYIFALCAKENRSSLELKASEIVLDNAHFPLSDHCGVIARFRICRKVTINDVMESLKVTQPEHV